MFTFSLLIRSAAERASLSSEERVVFSRSALWWGESKVWCSQGQEQPQVHTQEGEGMAREVTGKK